MQTAQERGVTSAKNSGHYDVPVVWRGWAEKVRGRAIDCGRYIPEEAPEETFAELNALLNTRLQEKGELE